jgi:peptide deformylase
VRGNRNDEAVLKKPTKSFDLADPKNPVVAGKKFRRKEMSDLIAHMKQVMKRENGVGLSANQIGLPYRLFVAQVYDTQGNSKFYAVLNPKLEKTSRETITHEEGCLSIPGLFGNVPRSQSVTISGYDKNGKRLKMKAWGLLARVFQHEIDHLDGKLFTDRTKETFEIKNENE